MKKRILSLLFAIMMIAAMLPTSVSADLIINPTPGDACTCGGDTASITYRVTGYTATAHTYVPSCITHGKSYAEAHKMLRDTCIVCGYSTSSTGACAHEYEYTYGTVDASSHSKSGTCIHCSEKMRTILEGHTYTDGVCVCGHRADGTEECAHEYEYTYSSVNATTHSKSGTCIYCAEKTDVSLERHNYTDGVCACGYSIPVSGECTHKYEYTYSIVNEKVHRKSGICIHCSDRENVPLEMHTYTDGVCVCGATEPCPEGTHEYSTLCDAECNRCGAIRVPEHNPSGYPCDNYCIQCSEPLGNTADHNYECQVAVDPTCAEDGYYAYYCTVCDEFYEETPPASGEHDYACYQEEEPTCVKDGALYYQCTQCGDAYVEPLPATGWHAYEYECSGNCLYCGMVNPNPGDHVSGAEYPCKEGPCLLCGAIAPAGDHLADGHPCMQWCNWCGESLPAIADHEYECNTAEPPTCNQEGYYYYSCLACGDVYEEYPSATGDHIYDGDTDPDCNVCGEEREVHIPNVCAHEYDYDCSTICNLCGEVRERLAAHIPIYPCLDCECVVCGETVLAAEEHADEDSNHRCDRCFLWLGCDSDIHYPESPYACLDTACAYCGVPMPATEPHVSNNFECSDGWCRNGCQTPMPAITDHAYEYECSTHCTICGFNTRPEAACLPDDGWLSGADETHHGIVYYCQYCGSYLSDAVEEHYDEDGDGACDVCGYTACVEHVYDDNFDWYCNVCYEYRKVDIPMDILGVSVSEDVNGLAMIFSAKVEGIAFDGTRIIYDNATIGGHKLIGMGAVVCIYDETGYVPTLKDMANGAVDVPAVYAYDYDEATGTLYFAIRVTNIPDEHKDTVLLFSPYFIYENNSGEQDVCQTTAWGDSYNRVANAVL